MPTPEECTNMKVAQVSLDKRVDAIAERLDEVLEEVRSMRSWATKWGTILMLLTIIGKDALPIIGKVLAG